MDGDRDRRSYGRMRQQAVKQLKQSVQTGHSTGLPREVLDLFKPPATLKEMPPMPKKKPKLPYTGVAHCVAEFAAPGDPEYEPPPMQDIPEPRRFRNLELPTQARVEIESKLEK